MSKAAKQSIFILIILLVASLGFAGYTLFEKQNVEKAKLQISHQLQQSEERESKNLKEIGTLNADVLALKEEKKSIEIQLTQAQKDAQDLKAQVTKVGSERDKATRRIDQILEEHTGLKAKLVDLQTEIAQKDDEIKGLKESPGNSQESVRANPIIDRGSLNGEGGQSSTISIEKSFPKVSTSRASASSLYEPSSVIDEEYWASLLREKAALEVEIEHLKSILSKSSVQIVELKQANADLQLELDSLGSYKNEIEREIKHKTDLVNNLSLELARTKNDKKFISGQVENVTEENRELRQQIKQLMNTKSALEKSIVKISQDKDVIVKKLSETESVIQTKIDEIWNVKDSLDRTFDDMKLQPNEITPNIELSPIVVNGNGRNAGMVEFNEGVTSPGFQGAIVSINEDNHFVVVNIGESQGIKIGDILSVYRDKKYIARLEVIQVRKDISAADIKDQWSKIQAGDSVQ